MTVRDFINKRMQALGRGITVSLVGLGTTNRAVFDRISDVCTITVRSRECIPLPDGCVGYFGDGYLDGIYEDVLFLSPSVRRDIPKIQDAKRRGITVTSECEVFFKGAENDERRIFAVTGSDGKTTVTSMASAMLSTVAVGNIGVPFSNHEGERDYVCELSSFNLFGLEPHSTAAVITSLSPNHLNWHTDLSEYYSAKLGIFKNARRRVIFAGGDCLSFIREGDTLFSRKASRNELLRLGAGHTVCLDNGFVCYDGEPIVHTSELSLSEGHNVLNLLAAIGLVYGYADTDRIVEVAKGFRPPRHRCERVHKSADGTTFIDSSIDTTPTRTATTLSGLDRSVFLILGGRGKGLSPLPLCEPIRRYVTRILAYGDFGREIARLLENEEQLSSIPVIFRERLSDGLNELKNVIRVGQTVILSPSATAYGEFENYEKRGDFFTEFVKKHFP